MPGKLWFYLIGPVIVFNTIPVCLFGTVFAIAYRRSGDPQDIDLSQLLFWLYFAVFSINWLLAIFVFQKYGIFFPDKLLITFLLGLLAGSYYTRERKLVPLMFTHAFMDTWSYGISLFVG